jgi:hypothetical protein
VQYYATITYLKGALVEGKEAKLRVVGSDGSRARGAIRMI